jgi:hypothetical protein
MMVWFFCKVNSILIISDLHKGVQNQFVVGTKSLWVSERLQDELIVRNNVAFELWAPDVRMAFVDDLYVFVGIKFDLHRSTLFDK